MLEDVHKPMKNLSEAFHKARKPVEASVEKTIKILLERRAEEARKKKEAFQIAKEAEKSWDSLADIKLKKAGGSEANKVCGESVCACVNHLLWTSPFHITWFLLILFLQNWCYKVMSTTFLNFFLLSS